MELDYKLVTDKDELAVFKDAIFGLFEQNFSRSLDPEIWRWQYLNNPIGDPVVSLCFDGDLLVGHYAALQLPIKLDRMPRKALLSTGSMVHSSYRKFGTFMKQGEEVYSYARDKFFCVMGFPNKKALPGRKKRLKWTVDEFDYVALVSGKQLVESEDFNSYLNTAKDVSLDIDREGFLDWRMAKPGVVYNKEINCIIKPFNSASDIVFIQEKYQDDLKGDKKYHVLCDGSIESLKDYKAFDYPFGYRIFDSETASCSFKKDLIMSDVF